jgi:hypothetical protein
MGSDRFFRTWNFLPELKGTLPQGKQKIECVFSFLGASVGMDDLTFPHENVTDEVVVNDLQGAIQGGEAAHLNDIGQVDMDHAAGKTHR